MVRRLVRHVLGRLDREEDGAALVLVALATTALFGMAALAVDLGNARAATRQVQSGVDGGALAPVQELPLLVADPATAEAARDLAAKYAAESMFQDDAPAITEGSLSGNARTYTVGDVTMTIESPYTLAGSTVASHSLIRVKACRPTQTFFASAIGRTSPTVCREAVARHTHPSGGYDVGLMSLDPASCSSMVFGGNSTTQLVPTGAVVVDSSCPNQAMTDHGTSWNLDTDFIGVVGGADIDCAPCTGTPPTVPAEGVDPVPDPLASMSVPSIPGTAGGCTVAAAPTPTEVCTPGNYTSELNLGANKTYILRPGLYYISAGGIRSMGSASVVCANAPVTVYVTGSPCDGVVFYIASGNVTLNGSGTVSLPAFTSGTCATLGLCEYVGVTMFQSRTNTSTMSLNGTSNFSIGSIYAPVAPVELNGNTGPGPATQVSVTGMTVGYTARLSGSLDFTINVSPPSEYVAPEDDYGLER